MSILLLLKSATGGGGGSGWGYSRAITIDETLCGTEDSAYFVKRFAGTYLWLATEANGGKLKDGTNGYDFAFYSDSGLTTPLKFQVVYHSLTTGEVEIWIQIPNLSTSANTVIYVAYADSAVTTDQSDSAGTYVTAYKAVYHLDETRSTSAGAYKDSTSNGNHATLTDANSNCVSAAVKCRNGMDFSGDDADILAAPHHASLSLSGSFTVSCWLSTDVTPSAGTFKGVLGKGNFSGTYLNYGILVDNGYINSGLGVAIVFQSSAGSTAACKVSISTATTYHVVGVFDTAANTLKIYLNGTLQATVSSVTIEPNTNTADLALGGASASDAYYKHDGKLDEVAILTGTVTDSWVTATYNSQHNPATFYSVGDETALGGGGTTQSVTAGGSGAVVIVRQVNRVSPIAATGTVFSVRQVGLSRAATGVGAGAQIRSASLSRLAAATGTATLAASRAFARALNAAANGTVAAARQIGRATAAAANGTATYIRSMGRTRAASGAGSASYQRQARLDRSASVTGSATLAAVLVFLRNLAASTSGPAAVARTISLGRTASVTGSAAYQRIVNRIRAATGTGSATQTSVKVLLRTLSVAGAGSASFVRQIWGRLAVAASGVATIRRSITATLAVSASAIVNLAKLIATTTTDLLLEVAAVGSAVLLRGLPATISAVANGTATVLKAWGVTLAVVATGAASMARRWFRAAWELFVRVARELRWVLAGDGERWIRAAKVNRWARIQPDPRWERVPKEERRKRP